MLYESLYFADTNSLYVKTNWVINCFYLIRSIKKINSESVSHDVVVHPDT